MNLITCLSVFISSVLWANEIFHHDLKGYPKYSDCNTQAQELAVKLQEQTHAEIYWAGFTKQTRTDCDLRISYTASTELPFESSMDRGISAGIKTGSYSSLKECEAKLPLEIDLFQKATGLKMWISYCIKIDRLHDPLPYFPVVEALGIGTLKAFSADTLLLVAPNSGWETIEKDFSSYYFSKDIILAAIKLKPAISASNRELSARFYSKTRLWLSSNRFSKHSDPNICEAQLDSVRSGLLKANIPPHSVYCGNYTQAEHWLNLISLSTNIFGAAQIEGILDSKTYESLNECISAAPSTLNYYKEKLGKKTLTSICGDGSGSFQNTIFIEKTP